MNDNPLPAHKLVDFVLSHSVSLTHAMSPENYQLRIFVSDLVRNHIVGFSTRWLIYFLKVPVCTFVIRLKFNIKCVFCTCFVPVNMCNIAGCPFTCSNTFLTQNVVDINEVVMGSNSEILSWICKLKVLINEQPRGKNNNVVSKQV